MTMHATPTTLNSIKNSLVALRMLRALEMLDATEQGEIDGIRSPRSASHRGTHRAREPARQNGAHVGPAHLDQNARRLRLHLPALTGQATHSRAGRADLHRPRRGSASPRAAR